MGEQPGTLEDIFLAALERTSATERRAYLDAACAGDAALRERLEALLSAHEDAGSFLEKPPEPLAAHNRETAGPNGPATECGAPPPAAPDLFGEFGAYRITGIIGQGGMGMVFLGHEARLNRSVAIKVLNPALASDPGARERFLREARVAAAIRHEHVITIHAIDEARGLPYLVMEYVEGGSLQQRLDREGPLPVEDVVRVAEQVAAGLEAAHAQGVIHRDIKPANILVEAVGQAFLPAGQAAGRNVCPTDAPLVGQAFQPTGAKAGKDACPTLRFKIADFGLARPADGGGITLSGAVAGSPQYMSPEQARGLRADERSDLFSLGCLLYALCVGRSPFRADSVAASLQRVREAAVEPVTRLNPAVPAWLGELIDRLLQKDPDRRIQSAREVAEALRRRAAPPARGRGRRRQIFVALAVLAVAATLGAVVVRSWWGKQDEHAGKNANAAPTAPAPADDHRGGEIRRLTGKGQMRTMALSPDEKRVYAGGYEGNIHVWDLGSGEQVRTIPIGSSVSKLRLSGDGARLAVTSPFVLWVFDPHTGEQRVKLPLSASIHDMVFLPDNRHLLCVFFGTGTALKTRKVGAEFDYQGLNVIDTETGKMARTLRLDEPHFYRTVACSPDGKWFAAGSDDGWALLVDAGEGKQVRAFQMTSGACFAVAFSHDGQRLFASDNSNNMRGWRLSDYRMVSAGTFPHPFTRFSFSPDDTWLALNGSQECDLYDLTSRISQATAPLQGHGAVIADIAFLKSGELVLTCSWDGTVRLWKMPPRPSPKLP